MSGRIAPCLSSERHDWETPDNVVDVVRKLGPIGLDPATTPANPTAARLILTPADDGLRELRWPALQANEVCYLNPPFKTIGDWVDRWGRESVLARLDGSHFVMLAPARPDTRWFDRLLFHSERVCWIRGRLKFRGAPAPAPFPTVLAYAGPTPGAFERAAIGLGWVMHAWSAYRAPATATAAVSP